MMKILIDTLKSLFKTILNYIKSLVVLKLLLSLHHNNKQIEIMGTTNVKIQEINNLYNSFENLTGADYRGWLKKLNQLKPILCDSNDWDELVKNIEIVKSKLYTQN